MGKTSGLVKFRVRITRIVTKDMEVSAQNMYHARNIGKSMAERMDWSDFDTLSYSVLAEPWNLSADKNKKSGK